jgi:hypothetical protein
VIQCLLFCDIAVNIPTVLELGIPIFVIVVADGFGKIEESF